MFHGGAHVNIIIYHTVIIYLQYIALHNGENGPRNPSLSINSTTSINHQYDIILQLHTHTRSSVRTMISRLWFNMHFPNRNNREYFRKSWLSPTGCPILYTNKNNHPPTIGNSTILKTYTYILYGVHAVKKIIYTDYCMFNYTGTFTWFF